MINAVIYVGRASHKGMVIGKSGNKLKEISTSARKDMEELLGHKVFLEVWVKVREGWSEDASFLQFMTQASDELLPLVDKPSFKIPADFDPAELEAFDGSLSAKSADFIASQFFGRDDTNDSDDFEELPEDAEAAWTDESSGDNPGNGKNR